MSPPNGLTRGSPKQALFAWLTSDEVNILDPHDWAEGYDRAARAAVRDLYEVLWTGGGLDDSPAPTTKAPAGDGWPIDPGGGCPIELALYDLAQTIECLQAYHRRLAEQVIAIRAAHDTDDPNGR
jgi:hypothetical protein